MLIKKEFEWYLAARTDKEKKSVAIILTVLINSAREGKSVEKTRVRSVHDEYIYVQSNFDFYILSKH